ncbi:MAG: DUF3365 domain-containing protein, partial [Desulfomonile tiedjei]|nr:DUF3365 domain-containing protein [Desulfomonile tiedjei]
MRTVSEGKSGTSGLGAYSKMALVAWTILIGGLFTWGVTENYQDTQSLASNMARAYLDKDHAFRLWGASHGGVYVLITDKTTPSPFLSHVPERDIETQSGRKLTLMTPAHMLRQLQEDFFAKSGVKGRITSIKHFRPEAAPDDWEQKALREFEKGIPEVSEITAEGAGSYLRLMKPLKSEKGCLKCHAEQGHKEGDVAGGVGISLPLKDILAKQSARTRLLLLSYS